MKTVKSLCFYNELSDGADGTAGQIIKLIQQSLTCLLALFSSP